MSGVRENSLEALTREIGERLYRDAVRSRPALFSAHGVRGALLERALADERLRHALFQFIDVLPQLTDSAGIAAHFRSYLGEYRLGGAWGRLFALGNHAALAWAARASVTRTARLFLAEEKPQAIEKILTALRRMGAHATFDAVGEAVLTEAEAASYAARYVDLLRWQEAAGIARPHISLKLTALTPRFDPLDATGTTRRVLGRLEPLLAEAQRVRATLTVDMEHHDIKSLILDIFFSIINVHRAPGWQAGIALQAYLPETERDLQEVIQRARAAGQRILVRLVKGAYWDTEVATARQRRWPLPVYSDKAATDASFERLTRQLFEAREFIHPAIASHNLRSLAHALALASAHGVGPQEWEIQMLYGMAEPLAGAVAASGSRLRIYVPTGDLATGIAYLIRRLLENTASTSVLRQAYAEAKEAAALLAAPLAPSHTDEPPQPSFVNTPPTDFSRISAQQAFREAIALARGRIGNRYRLAIPNARDAPAAEQAAVNPARPDEVLGYVELASTAHVEQAVANAVRAFPAWRDTPASQRTECLLRAAGMLLERRAQFAAWEVLEQGKSWREADADVAEAIDYLRYYAAEAVKLAGWRNTVDFPGENNVTRFEPRGVAAVISPWNFPLAILAGMTSAALASGNCAIMKPATPAMIVAHHFHALLLEAGLPPPACQLLPGRGSLIGDHLVRSPQIDIIAFTGSREAGLTILEQAARLAPRQTHLKRVVCEMGGKNAIIVDDDADLDEAVTHIMHSAFGYQGQKCSACSRLITVGGVHDRLVARLAAALASHPCGPPEDPQHMFGPLITRAAQQKALAYLEIGKTEGRLYYRGTAPDEGFYFAPAIFTGIQPHHRLAREEIFAPILAVLRAASFEQALQIALDSDYMLTGGVFSRLPEHLRLARDRYCVGNLYLNRRITGALVAVQPFGGVGLSGTGIQAGGPEYLKQFMWTRVVSENTMRHGYVPENPAR